MNGRLFVELAEVCEKIKETTSKLEKISKLGNFLKNLNDEELSATIRLLNSEILPPWYNKEIQVGYSTLSSIILEISGSSKEEFFKVYIKHGDLGETAEELLKKGKALNPLIQEKLTILKVYKTLLKTSEYSGEGSYQSKKNSLLNLFINASPIEAKYLVKIITGELRIGLSEGLLEESLAYALGIPLSNLREKVLILPDLAEVAIKIRNGKYEEIDLELLRPTSFMLAEPMSSPEEIANYFNKELIAEYKYDGIRAQIHKKGNNIRIFSRRLDEISFYLPEIVDSISRIKGDFILDSEIISIKNNKVVPFNILQRRLRRKNIDKKLIEEIPLRAIVYDILFYNGKQVYKLPLRERKELLKDIDLQDKIEIGFFKLVRNSAEISKLFEESLNKGFEGLMIKDPDSPYTPGKRGKAWVKLKKEFDTLDVVIVAAEYGHGKRAGILSDYTFAVKDNDELKIIGKAYSGLTDEEMEILDRKLREITIEDLGYKIIVRPEIVLEVAFDSIQVSDRHDSGFALRFPRIKRIRWDKSPNEIDSIEKVKEIYERKKAIFA
ncbi:MAG: ATP-dependent DNA ligase [Thermoproteota archaeon]|nr:ATP-dependent DNA ligase [Thermoproteota archaeon]